MAICHDVFSTFLRRNGCYLFRIFCETWQKLTDFIEVNINNLAAVPSIVFGLLGLAVFLNFFQLPRSAPLVGGMVLALMTLPTIIIASRAIRAVPPSIRDAGWDWSIKNASGSRSCFTTSISWNFNRDKLLEWHKH